MFASDDRDEARTHVKTTVYKIVDAGCNSSKRVSVLIGQRFGRRRPRWSTRTRGYYVKSYKTMDALVQSNHARQIRGDEFDDGRDEDRTHDNITLIRIKEAKNVNQIHQ